MAPPAPVCRLSEPPLREHRRVSTPEPDQVSQTGTNLLVTNATISLASFPEDLVFPPQNAPGVNQRSHVSRW